MILPMLPESGPLARALDAELSHHDMPHASFGQHRRALLKRGETQDEQAASPRRRKELQRLRRRLEEFAPVTFSTAQSPQPVAQALEDFLVLEASGWKGLAQTAAANDPAVRRFVETAVTSLAAQRQARIDRMQLNGQTVAVTITLQSGDTGWSRRSPTTRASRASLPACNSSMRSRRRWPHRLRWCGSTPARPRITR